MLEGVDQPAELGHFNLPDTTRPVISSVVNLGDNQTITVYFSEPVEAATAAVAANYSINNGVFGVFMADPNQPQLNAILDYPGSYHNGGSNLGFADGHAETHIWLDARTKPPIRGTPLQLGVYSPNNVDVQWLSSRTSALSQ